jgi:RNA polymerase sigma factor (sigma-70 family)
MFNEFPSGCTFLQRLDGAGKTREAAWRLFYEKYWDYIIHFSMRRGLRSNEAESVLQETVSRLLLNLPEFRKTYPQRGPFRKWVTGIARNVGYEEFRRRATNEGRHESFDAVREEGEGAALPLSEELSQTDLRETLRSAEDEALKQTVLRKAYAELQRSVDTKTWAVFCAYALEANPAADVAERFQLKLNNVFQIKKRLSTRLTVLVERIRLEMEE